MIARLHKYVISVFVITYSAMCMGCSIDDVSNFWVPLVINIKDIDRGVIYKSSTKDIVGITSRNFREGLNRGPYVSVTHDNSEFIISTNADYVNYENYETSQTFGITITFNCSSGSSLILVVDINIKDTNNNPPTFMPSDSYELSVAPPLPPGYLITDCVNNILIRDIDLTTKRIDFKLEDNTLFEISYDHTSSVPKEFNAILKTSSLIRSIPEPILLTISATDVDETGDPPRTKTGTIKITASNEFEFPDEPIFSQAFYFAKYTDKDEIEVQDAIYLSKGYDELVEFTFDGLFKEHFLLQVVDKQVRFQVSSPIPVEEFPAERTIYLTISAERDYTAGAVATVILEFPPLRELKFKEPSYKGVFEDNTVRLPAIVLNDEHNGTLDIVLDGEYSNHFSIQIKNNEIFIKANPALDESSIIKNDYLFFSLSATSRNTITAYTTILLKIIKDDLITPMFNKNVYYGNYRNSTNIEVEDIFFTQGLDQTVTIRITGEYYEYFDISNIENKVIVNIKAPLPADLIYERKVIVFDIIANKSRTVGANAAVSINFPEEYVVPRRIRFSKNIYNGHIEDNLLFIDSMNLDAGYTSDIKFILKGDYASYFRLLNNDNILSITMVTNEAEILKNKFISLEIEASGERSVPATSTVIIDIVSEPVPQIVFNKAYYRGSLVEENKLEFTETISLTNGYNETLIFDLEGDHSQWFEIVRISSNVISIVLNDSMAIPDEVTKQNRQLVYTISASTPEGYRGEAAIVIDLPEEVLPTILLFSKNTYNGLLDGKILTMEPITLENGYTAETKFILKGDYNSYFRLSNNDNILSITMVTNEAEILQNKFISLEIEASGERSVPATSTVIIDIVSEPVPQIVFNKAYYRGSLVKENKLEFTETISLANGYNETLIFDLEGDHSQWFEIVRISSNVISIVLNDSMAITDEVTKQNRQLVYTISASTPEGYRGEAAIVIDLPEEVLPTILLFSKNTYNGLLDGKILTMEPITLENGYTAETKFILKGDHNSYFRLSNNDNILSITIVTNEAEILQNKFISLEIEASGERSVPATSTVIIDIVSEPVPQIVFNKAYYRGSLVEENKLEFTEAISLANGYNESIVFILEGDHAKWFSPIKTASNSISIALKPNIIVPEEVIKHNTHIIFTIVASSEGHRGKAAVVISLPEDKSEGYLRFTQNYYKGYIDSDNVAMDAINLEQSPKADITLVYKEKDEVIIRYRDTIDVEHKTNILILTLQASSDTRTASAVIILEPRLYSSVPRFSETFYVGAFTESEGLILYTEIILIGYDESVRFYLEGDNSKWFSTKYTGSLVKLYISTSIPSDVIKNHNVLNFIITATNSKNLTAKATIVIEIISDIKSDTNSYFDKLLYIGNLQERHVTHELIHIQQYDGTSVDVGGGYADIFVASASLGVVTVRFVKSADIPANITYLALELTADGAKAVLVLNVVSSDHPSLPSVSFDSPRYTIRIDETQTGVIGDVHAKADNGEAVSYALDLENEHLQPRLSINSNGELKLSASATSGTYTFDVTATTVTTKVHGRSLVLLWVEAVTTSVTDINLPPLIIMERLEEEPHRNLVILNQILHRGCRYRLNNRWPPNQDWLYVDNEGLHAAAIDREHESIAFMAVSQVQVEIVLECEDTTVRTKRSQTSSDSGTIGNGQLNSSSYTYNMIDQDNADDKNTRTMGPYDYGQKSWILTEPIIYNSRRSLINLIVVDINDNSPIFNGKQKKPIYVGYPNKELEDTILPRALVDLQATDADIGENAAIVYWSSEENLAVSPTTGSVHVRDSSQLEDNTRYTVYAIDQNGKGLNGSIDIVVRLLDESHIAVLTIQDIFLDDEQWVIDELVKTLGYDVKVLNVFVTTENDTQTRKKREVNFNKGISLQLYVYGIVGNSPLGGNKLARDINNSNLVTVNVVRILSLEDHLQDVEICAVPARDTVLFAATITLTALLFILIVAISLCYILRWKNKSKYKQFNDVSSLASKTESPQIIPKVPTHSRLDIGELKRSEQRLQDLLDDRNNDGPNKENDRREAIIDISAPAQQSPIVIQSIDKLKTSNDDSDNDEFGEIKFNNRKSVVTFNESVEKIIHIDHSESNESDYEVYKF